MEPILGGIYLTKDNNYILLVDIDKNGDYKIFSFENLNKIDILPFLRGEIYYRDILENASKCTIPKSEYCNYFNSGYCGKTNFDLVVLILIYYGGEVIKLDKCSNSSINIFDI